jgi:hypothetical protein
MKIYNSSHPRKIFTSNAVRTFKPRRYGVMCTRDEAESSISGQVVAEVRGNVCTMTFLGLASLTNRQET